MTILTLPLPRRALDETTFADVMAHLPSGVAVVAWNSPDGPRGLLVNSLSVLSTTPARVLFGVAKADADHGSLLAAEACGVSLLAETGEAEAQRFAGGVSQHERFTANRWRLVADEPPQFVDGLARLTGVIEQKIDAGSHSLFVVRVGAAAVRDEAPLVYFDRTFRRLQSVRRVHPVGASFVEA
jgi:flavin reductase (DIM6/NTAB) family NADH-FMN oxidoreductase RutF